MVLDSSSVGSSGNSSRFKLRNQVLKRMPVGDTVSPKDNKKNPKASATEQTRYLACNSTNISLFSSEHDRSKKDQSGDRNVNDDDWASREKRQLVSRIAAQNARDYKNVAWAESMTSAVKTLEEIPDRVEALLNESVTNAIEEQRVVDPHNEITAPTLDHVHRLCEENVKTGEWTQQVNKIKNEIAKYQEQDKPAEEKTEFIFNAFESGSRNGDRGKEGARREELLGRRDKNIASQQLTNQRQRRKEALMHTPLCKEIKNVTRIVQGRTQDTLEKVIQDFSEGNILQGLPSIPENLVVDIAKNVTRATNLKLDRAFQAINDIDVHVQNRSIADAFVRAKLTAQSDRKEQASQARRTMKLKKATIGGRFEKLATSGLSGAAASSDVAAQGTSAPGLFASDDWTDATEYVKYKRTKTLQTRMTSILGCGTSFFPNSRHMGSVHASGSGEWPPLRSQAGYEEGANSDRKCLTWDEITQCHSHSDLTPCPRSPRMKSEINPSSDENVLYSGSMSKTKLNDHLTADQDAILEKKENIEYEFAQKDTAAPYARHRILRPENEHRLMKPSEMGYTVLREDHVPGVDGKPSEKANVQGPRSSLPNGMPLSPLAKSDGAYIPPHKRASRQKYSTSEASDSNYRKQASLPLDASSAYSAFSKPPFVEDDSNSLVYNNDNNGRSERDESRSASGSGCMGTTLNGVTTYGAAAHPNFETGIAANGMAANRAYQERRVRNFGCGGSSNRSWADISEEWDGNDFLTDSLSSDSELDQSRTASSRASPKDSPAASMGSRVSSLNVNIDNGSDIGERDLEVPDVHGNGVIDDDIPPVSSEETNAHPPRKAYSDGEVDNLKSFGSKGHPDFCCRACLYYWRGECKHGKECPFCHFPHPKRPPRLNKRHRHILDKLSYKKAYCMMVPVILEKCQKYPGIAEKMDELLKKAKRGAGPADSVKEKRMKGVISTMPLGHIIQLFRRLQLKKLQDEAREEFEKVMNEVTLLVTSIATDERGARRLQRDVGRSKSV